MKIKGKYMYCLSGLLFIVSCTYKKGVIPLRSNAKVADSCYINISYTKDINRIMTTYCGTGSISLGTCHQAGKGGCGYSMADYISMSHYFSLIKTRINLPDVDASKMPKSISKGPKTMTDCDLSKLNAWLDNGHPNN